MSEAMPNPEFESLLLRALAPVDPPERLSERLEQTLTALTDLAAEELEAWGLSSRGAPRNGGGPVGPGGVGRASTADPRNWVRPVVAAGVGATAGTSLVIVRVRSKNKRHRVQSKGFLDLAERTLRDVAAEARDLLDR